MSFGVTSAGFVTKELADILDEIETRQRNDISPGLNQTATSVFGQLNGGFAAQLAEAWSVLESVARAFDPDNADGDLLDALCALAPGITRLAATKSTVTLTATGTPTTALTAGRLVSASGNSSAKFTTLDAATIAAVSAWASATAYTLGQRVTNGGKVYQVTTAGTSAGSGGPSGTSSAITDNTVTWRYLGDGTGAVDVEAEATETGPTAGVSGTLTVIETAVTGWDSVINVLDAETGRDIESDAALRLRRAEVLQATGSGTRDAIRADVLRVDGVTECYVFNNPTDTTDSDGVPPHAFEVLALGGDDDEIAQAIWDSGSAGIEIYGSTSGTATDAHGDDQTVEFSRPTEVNIYHVIDVKIDSDTFPSDGDDQIKAAVVAFGDALAIGDDVVSSAHYASIFGVSGVLDVTAVKIGTAPAPATTTTVTITSRQLAAYDTSRITVNHV